MSTPYTASVHAFAKAITEARHLPLGGFAPAPCPALAADAPCTMVFSPHPDDESIIGAMALRLRREAGHRVFVVAVTQGSKVDRQAARLEEMRGACGFLGWDLLTTQPNGLSGITPKTRETDPAAWNAAVDIAERLIRTHKPKVIITPHEGDGHATHQGAHYLALDALRRIGAELECHVVFTEFWAAMPEPNLMVESTPDEVADLMAAISFHKGEVARNPYHALLPSWMADNVRRGSELLGGRGGAAVDFTFATLYRIARWNGRELVAPAQSCSLPSGKGLGELLG